MKYDANNGHHAAIRQAIESYLNRIVGIGKTNGSLHLIRIPFWYADGYWYTSINDLTWRRPMTNWLQNLFAGTRNPVEYNCGQIQWHSISSDAYWKLVDLMNYDIENQKR